jgi:hypothetical protein
MRRRRLRRRKSFVRPSAAGERAPHVRLDPVQRERARRQRREQRTERVEQHDLAPVRPEVVREARHGRREPRERREIIAPRQRDEARAGETRQRALVGLDRVPDLRRRHAVREERRDERPGARADVKVEVAGREVLEQRVEGEEHADFVETADDPAPGERERAPRRPVRVGQHGNPGRISAGSAAVLRLGT